MKHFLQLAACLMATLCTGLAFAQTASAQDGAGSTTTTSPVAYFYVTSNPSSNTYEINAYNVASNGSLTAMAGSPFGKTSSSLSYMAHTTHFLFVTDGINIYTDSIASSGALKQLSSVNAQQHDSFPGSLAGPLVLDHTGATLYNAENDGLNDTEFQFYSKNNTTGALTYFGSIAASATDPLAFSGNNLYAYDSACYQAEQHFNGYSRRSDGSLVDLNISPPIPSNPNGDYCPDIAAADPTSHLAVVLYPNEAPPAQLAVYTIQSSGSLTTSSTYQNMPSTAVGTVNDMNISPAGNLLAVAGTSGLQVFHFNGSSPITAYTGLLATHPVDEVYWDTHNHLYGVSRSSGRLYVFTVTPTSHVQAPGSPHLITNPKNISVLSK